MNLPTSVPQTLTSSIHRQKGCGFNCHRCKPSFSESSHIKTTLSCLCVFAKCVRGHICLPACLFACMFWGRRVSLHLAACVCVSLYVFKEEPSAQFLLPQRVSQRPAGQPHPQSISTLRACGLWQAWAPAVHRWPSEWPQSNRVLITLSDHIWPVDDTTVGC